MNFIECAPPTPNGKLHLGHMAGPYVAADVFNRLKQSQGGKTFFACDIDFHQNYVDLAAAINCVDKKEFLTQNINSIKDTFANYDVGFDFINYVDSPERSDFISCLFSSLFKSKYVVKKSILFFFDEVKQQYLVEAFISGKCPKCLNIVKGGVCEVCGTYNFSTNMLDPYSTMNKDAVISRRGCEIFVLNSKELYPVLIDALDKIIISDDVKGFLKAILADFNGEFPLTLPLDSGIYISGESTRLNPWVELLGSTYYLKSKACNSLNCANNNLVHTCFIGIDNTFYYLIIHNLLRICLHLGDFPIKYSINKFYLLNNSKFSTSRGNAIWAEDMVSKFDINLLRLFLIVTHPIETDYAFSMNMLIDFKNRLGNNWIERVHKYLQLSDLSNDREVGHLDAKIYVKELVQFLSSKNNDQTDIFLPIQAICPSLYKKILRQITRIPHIVKETSNSFKRELGVELNRLIMLDEYKFSSSIVIVEPGRQTAPHSHGDLEELFYIIKGKGVLTLDGKDITVNIGSYMYIPAGTMHTIKPFDNNELRFITIAWYI